MISPITCQLVTKKYGDFIDLFWLSVISKLPLPLNRDLGLNVLELS